MIKKLGFLIIFIAINICLISSQTYFNCEIYGNCPKQVTQTLTQDSNSSCTCDINQTYADNTYLKLSGANANQQINLNGQDVVGITNLVVLKLTGTNITTAYLYSTVGEFLTIGYNGIVKYDVQNNILKSSDGSGSINVDNKNLIGKVWVYDPEFGNQEVEGNVLSWNETGNISILNRNLTEVDCISYNDGTISCSGSGGGNSSFNQSLTDSLYYLKTNPNKYLNITNLTTLITNINTTQNITANDGTYYGTVTTMENFNGSTLKTNITAHDETLGGTLYFNETSGACDLTKNHSICSNASGTYIVG